MAASWLQGERVPRTSFWLKRLADGDVVNETGRQGHKQKVEK